MSWPTRPCARTSTRSTHVPPPILGTSCGRLSWRPELIRRLPTCFSPETPQYRTSARSHRPGLTICLTRGKSAGSASLPLRLPYEVQGGADGGRMRRCIPKRRDVVPLCYCRVIRLALEVSEAAVADHELDHFDGAVSRGGRTPDRRRRERSRRGWRSVGPRLAQSEVLASVGTSARGTREAAV